MQQAGQGHACSQPALSQEMPHRLQLLQLTPKSRASCSPNSGSQPFSGRLVCPAPCRWCPWGSAAVDRGVPRAAGAEDLQPSRRTWLAARWSSAQSHATGGNPGQAFTDKASIEPVSSSPFQHRASLAICSLLSKLPQSVFPSMFGPYFQCSRLDFYCALSLLKYFLCASLLLHSLRSESR